MGKKKTGDIRRTQAELARRLPLRPTPRVKAPLLYKIVNVCFVAVFAAALLLAVLANPGAQTAARWYWLLLAAALGMALAFGACRLFMLLKEPSRRGAGLASAALFAVLLALQILFGLLMRGEPLEAGDFGTVYSAASAYAQTGQPAGEYLLHQPALGGVYLLMCGYFSLLGLFGVTGFALPAMVLNLLAIDGAVLLLYFCVRRVFGLRKAMIAMVACVFTLPFVLYVPILFTASLAMPAPVAMVLLWLRGRAAWRGGEKKKAIIQFCLMSLVAGLGALIKPTVLVLWVAAAIDLLVLLAGRDRWKPLLAGLGIVALLFAGGRFGMRALPMMPAPDAGEGFPLSGWMLMGFSGNGGMDEEIYSGVLEQGGSAERAVYADYELGRHLGELGFGGVLQQLGRKLAYTFGDGSYEAPAQLESGAAQWNFLQDYVLPFGARFEVFYYVAFGLAAAVLGWMTVAAVLALRRKNNALSFVRAALLGLALVLLVWRTGPGELVCFVPLMLLCALEAAPAPRRPRAPRLEAPVPPPTQAQETVVAVAQPEDVLAEEVVLEEAAPGAEPSGEQAPEAPAARQEEIIVVTEEIFAEPEEAPAEPEETAAEPEEATPEPEEAPADTAEAASEPEEAPAEPEEAPADTAEATPEPEEAPAEPEEAPADTAEAAPEPEEAPAEPEETAAEPEEATPEPEEAPAEPEEATAEPEEAPVEPEETAAEPEEATPEPEEAPADTAETAPEPEEIKITWPVLDTPAPTEPWVAEPWAEEPPPSHVEPVIVESRPLVVGSGWGMPTERDIWKKQEAQCQPPVPGAEAAGRTPSYADILADEILAAGPPAPVEPAPAGEPVVALEDTGLPGEAPAEQAPAGEPVVALEDAGLHNEAPAEQKLAEEPVVALTYENTGLSLAETVAVATVLPAEPVSPLPVEPVALPAGFVPDVPAFADAGDEELPILEETAPLSGWERYSRIAPIEVAEGPGWMTAAEALDDPAEGYEDEWQPEEVEASGEQPSFFVGGDAPEHAEGGMAAGETQPAAPPETPQIAGQARNDVQGGMQPAAPQETPQIAGGARNDVQGETQPAPPETPDTVHPGVEPRWQPVYTPGTAPAWAAPGAAQPDAGPAAAGEPAEAQPVFEVQPVAEVWAVAEAQPVFEVQPVAEVWPVTEAQPVFEAPVAEAREAALNEDTAPEAPAPALTLTPEAPAPAPALTTEAPAPALTLTPEAPALQAQTAVPGRSYDMDAEGRPADEYSIEVGDEFQVGDGLAGEVEVWNAETGGTWMPDNGQPIWPPPIPGLFGIPTGADAPAALAAAPEAQPEAPAAETGVARPVADAFGPAAQSAEPMAEPLAPADEAAAPAESPAVYAPVIVEQQPAVQTQGFAAQGGQGWPGDEFATQAPGEKTGPPVPLEDGDEEKSLWDFI